MDYNRSQDPTVEKIAEWLGTPETVCLNSQIAAAETCLRLLGISENDEVIAI